MRPFEYERAADAAAAVEAVAAPGTMFLAGGTNLVDLMKLGVETPERLVDVSRLPHDAIEELPGGGLRIGAAVRNSALSAHPAVRERYPLLARSLLSGASGQLRNVATIGGNLLQRTRCAYFQDVSKPCNKRRPGSGCPARDGDHRNLAILGHSAACVATHPSDMAVALAAIGADVLVTGAGGERTVPLPGLHRLPGDEPERDTVLEPGELITGLELAPLSFGARSTYRKVRERASFSFAVASVAAAVDLDGGTVADCRIAFGGLAHAPWRAARAEEALRGGPATAERFAAAADAELAHAEPLRDNAFKVPLARNLLIATLAELCEASVMATTATPTTLGAAVTRVEGREKVTGEALYAYEHDVEGVAYAWIVQATIAKGAVRAVDGTDALGLEGVLAVLSHENAPDLGDVEERELAVLQSPRVAYRGQIVALAIAETLEAAQQAADLVRIEYAAEAHDVELSAVHPKLYTPEKVNPNFPSETDEGDVDAALEGAAVVLDETYTTPAEHNNPMEPHATLAVWSGGDLTLYDSTQGAPRARDTIAGVLGLAPERVRVISPHVGGGFGSKGTPRPTAIAAALAAQHVERPVKLTATRQQMFSITGYRTPTIQRLRLGAASDGRLLAIEHIAFEQTSTLKEFAEQTAIPTRMMYASESRRTGHRLAALDVPTPSWMRAPGETPGMYALECAMDELAIRCGLDPIELRVRNEPDIDPETGLPFSSRGLLACLHEGAARFGWDERDPTPGTRRDGPWLVGTGVAASTYPARRAPSEAFARAQADGTFVVGIGAADIGTGARTVLTQIAADALEVPPDRVRVEIGDSDLPFAMLAGGSMGTTSWGSAIVRAIEALRARLAESGGDVPPDGIEARAGTAEEIKAQERYARHAYGAQFCEARVNTHTGEVRVSRMLGVFACGRILNPLTSRSQFIGGMTQGISMALHEESVLDLEFGDYLNHDFAQYHVPVFADIADIEATWIEEEDPHLNPMGAKGIGEIGIVGTAAAVANAVHHATGVRVRDLPIRLDRVLRLLAR